MPYALLPMLKTQKQDLIKHAPSPLHHPFPLPTPIITRIPEELGSSTLYGALGLKCD